MPLMRPSAWLSWTAIALISLHPQAASSPPSPVAYDGSDQLAQATTLCTCSPSLQLGRENVTLPPSLGTSVGFPGSLPEVAGTPFSWLLGRLLPATHTLKTGRLYV